MAKKFLAVASVLVFAITTGMLLGNIDRDIIAAKEAKAKPAAKLVQNKKPVVVVVPADEEEKPELRKFAACIKNQPDGRLVLDEKDKDGNDLFWEFSMNRLRLCTEVGDFKPCSHEQRLNGEFVEGKDDADYRHNLNRGLRLCGFQSHAHTVQSLFTR